MNTHTPGARSDDDALEVAARALLHGHSPYRFRTYPGNALQNLFWLAAFFVCVARQRDGKTALSMAWLSVLALVQAFPIVAGVVLGSILTGRLDLTYARYGAFFAWFVFLSEAVATPRDANGLAHDTAMIVR